MEEKTCNNCQYYYMYKCIASKHYGEHMDETDEACEDWKLSINDFLEEEHSHS